MLVLVTFFYKCNLIPYVFVVRARVCVRVCVYVCMNVSGVYACVCLCTVCVRTHMCSCVCTYVCMYVHVICVYVCVYVRGTCVCMVYANLCGVSVFTLRTTLKDKIKWVEGRN